ncbi:MAG: hypothetical protein Q4G67_09835, partial [Actinomycetia bacterium]|nr:hypothetical protein [Actinomycetes bacterium]
MPRARAARALALSTIVALVLAAVTAALPPSAAALGRSLSPVLMSAAATSTTSAGVTVSGVSPLVSAPGEEVIVTGRLDVAALGIDLSPPATQGPGAIPPNGTPGISDGDGTTTDPVGGATDTETTTDTVTATDTETATDIGPSTDTVTVGGTAPGEPESADPVVPAAAWVDVRLDARGLRSEDDIAGWISSSQPATGRVLGSTQIDAGTGVGLEVLPFSVPVSLTVLDVGRVYGVLPISVEVRVPGAAAPVASVHTFLGYQIRKEYVPLELSWAIPFTVPPDAALLGDFGPERTAAWENLLGPAGSLRQRLRDSGDDIVAWVLDPALLEAGPAPLPPDGPTDPAPATTAPAPAGSGTESATGS